MGLFGWPIEVWNVLSLLALVLWVAAAIYTYRTRRASMGEEEGDAPGDIDAYNAKIDTYNREVDAYNEK